MEDFILNGVPTGTVAQRLLACNMDAGVLRPFIGNDGRSYVTVNHGGKPKTILSNTTATLRKDDWKIMDEAVIKAARARMRVVADLRGAGLQFVIPNGMGKTVLEYEDQSDITDASISMDPLRRTDGDRPVYDLKTLPLPVTHKDFDIGLRQLLASRNSNTPLDTTMAELAGTKVAESVEKLTVGANSTFAFGGGTVYGFTNYTNRLTKTITAPTAGGWTPADTVQEVLAMKTQSQDAYHYGPWTVYCTTDWDQYMDDDYSAAKGDLTLRQRLRMIEGIQDVKTADHLNGTFVLMMVQQTTNVVRMVIGMEVATVQWESQGGFGQHFKVLTIMVPQLRADQNSNTGIVHGAPA